MDPRETNALGRLGKVGAARNDQVHGGKLDLVYGTLLGRKGADLVWGHNHILALLFLVLARAASGGIASLEFGASGPVGNNTPLGRVLGASDVPDTDGSIGTTRDQHRRLNAPAEGPDSSLAVASHALQKATRGQIPQVDRTLIIRSRKDLAITAAFHSGNVASDASEHPHSISSGDCPHTHGVVRASSEDVGRVGMKADAVHILIVTSKNALLTDVIRDPETSRAVRSTGDEIMTERPKAHVPDRAIMALVDDNAGPSIERPQSDRLVCGRGKEVTSIGRHVVVRGDVFSTRGTRLERDRIDRTRVSNQAARVDGGHVVKIGIGSLNVTAIQGPDADV